MTASKPRKRAELLSSYLKVTHWRANLSVHVDKERGRPAERGTLTWLTLEGELVEALKGVTQAVVSLHLSSDVSLGRTPPPSIGSILQIKPKVEILIPLSEAEFNRVWMLASTNHIRSCYLAFYEPFRGHSRVVSFAVGSTLPEDE